MAFHFFKFTFPITSSNLFILFNSFFLSRFFLDRHRCFHITHSLLLLSLYFIDNDLNLLMRANSWDCKCIILNNISFLRVFFNSFFCFVAVLVRSTWIHFFKGLLLSLFRSTTIEFSLVKSQGFFD